jgi:DNA-binding transcriptional ArsR family regulator
VSARRDAVFRAVSEPTRRAILDHLRRGERSVSRLCEEFDVSQPAISQHLKVLREAGLVAVREDGRTRFYRLEPRPLREVARWIEHYEKFWDEKLGALGELLNREDDEA